MSDNIKVAIKVRPLVDREKDDPLQWSVSGNTITPTDSKRRGEAGFQFDHIFDMQKKNTEIFNTVVKPIVNSAVDGFNGTVFAYGQTGSGKTYTMMGTEAESGIIPLAIEYMFDAIESKEGREFLIRFSYFEIYNEKINDLMEVENTDLKIKDENGRVFVNKCSEKITRGAKHMLTSMRLGEKNRSIGETNMNERSSRSHTIFRITIESREISSDSDGAIQISQLNLVDLAGSERASQTGATGDRFKEGKHINLSLSTLGLVIKQLSETQDKDKPNFVNFRDSKLTRILQVSLGGNSLTAIICTVTPATFEETYCTLSFASRAKSIQNKPKLNEDLSEEALLKRYRKQIVQLTKELEKANQTIKDRQNNVLVDRLDLLKEYILTGNRKKNFRRRSCPVKFNYENTFTTELPTIREAHSPDPAIREAPSPETPQIDKIKRRQSIMQNVNLANETFETAFADFELELLQSEFPPDEDVFITTRRKLGVHRVQFNDNVHVFNDTPSSCGDTPVRTPSTPRRRCNCVTASSPGTPKSILRERLKTVNEEHAELEEFTVLEKQLNRDEIHSMNLDDNEKTLRHLRKSLEDTSILYTDVNKKYSDLQTEHSRLVGECGQLRKQVESLSVIQERLGRMEIENKDLNTKLNAAVKKQKFLEDENASQAFQMESLQTKFKAREKELESSLQLAWKGCDPAQLKESANEILHLQTLVKTLTEEGDVLKSQKSPITESNPLVTEIEILKQKLEETNRLLKESDFEKASLVERLDSISQRSLMRSKIEEYDKLLGRLEEEKVLSLQQFEELSKECEGIESCFQISALQKAVENLSSHLTELEQGGANVRNKFSVSLACIEFLCQQNSDKLLDDGLDVSLNFEDWKKTISYNEKEKSDIICGLQKFRESVIRKSKSMESKHAIEYQKVEIKREDKETLTEEENVQENLQRKENMNAKIEELILKVEEANLEKQRLENELGEVKSKLLEAGDKWKDHENEILKLEYYETELEELNERFKKLETENCDVKFKLHESTEKLNNYENGVEFLKFESEFESKLAEKEAQFCELNSKVIELEVENLEIKSSLAEALKKLKNFENGSQNLEKEYELSNKLKELEEQNSLIKSQLSEAEEKLSENVLHSSKLNAEFDSKMSEKESQVSELRCKVKEFEDENVDLKLKLREAEEKLVNYETLESDNQFAEKETEVNDLKLKFEELNLENVEIKFKLAEAEDKLKNYEKLIETSKSENRSIEDLESKLTEKEAKINEFAQKSEELERLNSEIKSQLLDATEKIQSYVKIVESLKSESKNLEEANAEIKSQLLNATEKIQSYVNIVESSKSESKNLEEENAEIKSQLLNATEKIQSYVNINESSKSESKNLEEENAEIKSQLLDATEKIQNYVNVVESLKSEFKNLEEENAEIKLQLEAVDKMKNGTEHTLDSQIENEAVVSQLSLRIKELMDENFELKSKVEDVEERSKNDEVTIKSLNSDVERLNAKLQEREIYLSHLKMRYKELESINNSFTKFHSMNNTSEEPFADLKAGEDFVKTYVAESDAIKKRLEDFEKNVSIFRENVDQQIHFVEGLEKGSVKNVIEASPSLQNKMSTPRKLKDPETRESPKAVSRSFSDENEYTSIFANNSYFEKMEVSGGEEMVTENETQSANGTQNESQDFTAPSMMINILKSNNVPILKRRIKDLETRNEQLDILYKELIEKVNDTGCEELANAVKEFRNVKISLEIENSRLSEDLQQKINESEEIKNGIRGLKMDIEKLQQTIYLLNSENLDLTSKLNAEKDKIKEAEGSSQILINELKTHVSQISDEKAILEKEVSLLNEKLNSANFPNPITSDEEIKSKLNEYHQKIDDLGTENRKLTNDLMDSIKELDSVKECKALQYDHECNYKEKNRCLMKENEELQKENSELSEDLMKHIDECEILKQDLETASKKLSIYEQSLEAAESPENVQTILQEKTRLEAKIIELTSKITQLSNENTEFTSSLSVIFDEFEKNPEVDNPSRNSILLPTSLESQSRRVSNSFRHDESLQVLNNKIKTLQDQVEHLTLLNTKLSDLKLSSCTQCAHLRELNENRRALKLEVKSLNNKLEDLQVKFRQKCANTDVLRLKASEELNKSGNTSLNGSMGEGLNITLMEENIRILSSEKETLKEEYNKLSNLYQEKCSDLETLQDCQSGITSPTSASPMIPKKKERLLKVESAIKQVGADLHQQREKLSNLNNELQKFKELKDRLKFVEDSAATADEKVKLLESDIASLYKNIDGLNESEKTLKTEKLNLEVELETFKVENQGNKKLIGNFQKTVNELNEEKKSLNWELEVAREEKEQLLARQKYEDSNREMLEATLKEYRDSIEDSEKRFKEISSNLNKAVAENQDLKNEITRLESLQKAIELKTEGVEDSLKELKSRDSQKELESAKLLIIKEMKSLTSEVQDPSNNSVSDLFQVFLKTIMSKEHEIMKALKDRFDNEKLKLEEAKEQSEDAEKRANTWAKSLENDIEKLQSDLTLLESKNLDLQKQIERLENVLEETQHENQSLKEKVQVLEIDYHALQVDLENSKSDAKGDMNASQERERMQVSIKNKELELQSKMKQEKEEYNKKLGDLTNTLKTLETKNIDLKNNLDGYEANEKQLKSIIDIKTNEIVKNNQKIKDLQVELAQLVEVNNRLSEENLEKNHRIEEITSLLKSKCDSLSEYKTKLETLMPEYDHMRLQIEERKLSVEKYKKEIETLRADTTRELNLFKDKFAEEEIKSAGLSNQLTELNAKNGVLLQELETMREKCMELEAANEKLMRKIRNSTSKTRVEKEMEELMDKNRTLENNLEGASNRIADLQEARSKTMKELVDLKGQVETVKRENEELKKAVDAFKLRHNYSDIMELRGKYEELLQEKNRIKLELEEKKLLLAHRDRKIEEISEELRELAEKNAELDKEADELAEEIKEKGAEIGKIEDENYHLKEKFTKEIENLRSQFKHATSINMELRGQIEIMRRTEVSGLRKENEELKEKLFEVERRLEAKSCPSSRSTSPMAEVSKRKKRRSELFNQKRHLDDVSDSGLSSSSTDCACSDLRKTVADLGKEIAMKNGVIAALNVQIQSENFPYQKKCKDLQDELILQKTKTRQLLQEISNLKKAMMDTSAHECKVCKDWRLNQKHQEVQCKIEEKTYLSGTSSGIVGEFKHIEKLEKEKALMRQLCRSRLAQIKQLEAKVEELSTNIKLTNG